jgi:hypothetical protein
VERASGAIPSATKSLPPCSASDRCDGQQGGSLVKRTDPDPVRAA